MPAGKVYLVGAGPGAPDLITLRGLRALRESSWIIADSLLPEDYVEGLGISPATRVTSLEHGDTRDRHAEIMEQIARATTDGQIVARLKNGDPFVFGRGCEEIAFLTERGIAWEVIPGVSVCTGGPTAGTLPLTSRDRGRSFAVVTARRSGGGVSRGFPVADTLIIFMGTGVLDEIASTLVAEGWSPQTPAAVLSRVSLAWERHCSGPLHDVASTAEAARLVAPAILVVGQAAAAGDVLPRRPRILYAGAHPAEHAHLGEVVHWPALIADGSHPDRRVLADRLGELQAGGFDWIAFADAASARFFFQEMDRRSLDARLLGAVRIAAADGLCRHLLRERGLRADAGMEDDAWLDPKSPIHLEPGRRVLICAGRDDRERLDLAVCKANGSAASLELFEYRAHPDLGLPLPVRDVVFFTKPAEVQAYVQAYGPGVLDGDVWYAHDRVRDEVAALRRAVDRRAEFVLG